MNRLKGIDSLRFVLAVWVALHHCGKPSITPLLGTNSPFSKAIEFFYANSVCGEFAVLVFFVISGFCIHYPFRHGERPNLWIFYPRRHIRILLPCFMAIVYAAYVGVPYLPPERSVLWSIVCEEVYYTIYPLFLLARKKLSWKYIFIVTGTLSTILLPIMKPIHYHGFGDFLNPVFAFPVWLLGAKIAEEIDPLLETKAPLSRSKMWLWRLAIFALSVSARILNEFHINYAYTLNIMAVPVYFWIRHEIVYMQANKPPAILEWGGKWSYSIYLVHSAAAWMMANQIRNQSGKVLEWCLYFSSVLAVCYIFYLLIEKPSHHLARRMRNIYKKPDAVPDAEHKSDAGAGQA